jgi:hypothetical protein
VLKCGPTRCVSCNIFFYKKYIYKLHVTKTSLYVVFNWTPLYVVFNWTSLYVVFNWTSLCCVQLNVSLCCVHLIISLCFVQLNISLCCVQLNISLCCVQLNNVILGKFFAPNKTKFQRPNYKSEIFVATRGKIVCDIVRFRNGTFLSPYSTIPSHCLHWFHSSDQDILRFLRVSGFDTGSQFCRDVFTANQQHYLVSCLMESDSRYKHKKKCGLKVYDNFLSCYKKRLRHFSIVWQKKTGCQ